MDQFRISGPTRLEGSVASGGAKNAALPALAASLLTDRPLVLEGAPRVRDIETMRSLLGHLGVSSRWKDGSIELEPGAAGRPDDAPYELVKTMRASVLVLGPLTARRGHARVSLPGGCAIGVRPIDQHLAGLEALGAEVHLEHGDVETRAERLIGTRFRFAMPTVTGTENLLMAAVLARGDTVLENCAREPEIVDLARLLVAMGAKIEGEGTSTLQVSGVDSLDGTRYRVIRDRIEGGTYLIGGALTGGDVELTGVDAADLAPLPEVLAACGAEVTSGAGFVRVARSGELLSRDLVTAPFPGFPTDLQAQYLALMTAASGVATVVETVFENRMQHVAELARMGAEIRLEGRAARVTGPRRLSGAHVMATDLRASACLVLAGVAAQGETLVDRIYHLDRGYESMESKLAQLGAQVERVRADPGGERR